MLDRDSYLRAFRSESAALAEAARPDPRAPLPSCPGWTIARLLGHLGAIYISIAKNIQFGQGEDVMQELEDLELESEYEAWFRDGRGLETLPPTVVAWYEQAAADLEAVFRETEPDTRAWTWYEPDQSVRFWMRRMTHETAVHRWDAQLAHGRAQPIDREIAEDGIDEALTIYQPQHCRPQSRVPGAGETFRFEQTDGQGSWVVRFEGDGMQVRRERAEADMAIRGTASDLLLFLWHRIPADQMEIQGDVRLADRYFELAVPD